MTMSKEEIARRTLRHGAKWPYDASDQWWNDGESDPPQPIDWAHAAARGVLADLNDRRGIKHGFANLDEDIRIEIASSLAEIIRQAHLIEQGDSGADSPEALKLKLVKAMYDAQPYTVFSPYLADQTGLPIGTVLSFEQVKEIGADFKGLERLADAVLPFGSVHSTDARPSRLVTAARKFVAKYDQAAPYIESAILVATNHHCPYTGPQYGEELAELISALADTPEGGPSRAESESPPT